MKTLVRRFLALFGAVRTPPNQHDDARHKAVLSRADRLLRVVHDYDQADEARRERR